MHRKRGSQLRWKITDDQDCGVSLEAMEFGGACQALKERLGVTSLDCRQVLQAAKALGYRREGSHGGEEKG